jgi:protein-tyrosine phosphatase
LIDNNKILIHCFAGKSRATSFTIAYLIHKFKMSLKDALILVRSVRPIAEPNPGFID